MERDVWEVVDGSLKITKETKPEENAKIEKKDKLALVTIAIGVSQSIKKQIMDCNSAKEVWQTLKNTYELSSMARFAALKDEFLDSRFDPETESMTNYIAKVTQAAKALLTVGSRYCDCLRTFTTFTR